MTTIRMRYRTICTREHVLWSGRGWPAWLLFLVFACGLSALGQEPKKEAETSPSAEQRDTEEAMPARESTEMKDMATSMKSMADMCRMMMQREMQSRPYLIAAGAVVGAFVLAALVFFVVLEVLWIHFFGVRIKTERLKLLSQAGK